MPLKIITTPAAPAAIGPYSQAIATDHLIFCSGQIGLNPKGELVEGIEAQTLQAISNLQAILQSEALTLQDIIKTTVYLAHMEDFPAMNQVYEQAFGDHKPARATVEVSKLPKDALVEIEAIALKT